MNYLAHAYLSFEQPEIVVGNMISDFVKGSRQFDYPDAIRQGISLHREIDGFTDQHASTRRAQEVFRSAYRLYSGAFVDVVYDHFLATDPTIFSGNSLEAFAQKTYRTLEKHTEWLPSNFLLMLPYMKQQNWLLNYSHQQGIAQSMRGLVRRSAYLSSSEQAFQLFIEHYDTLKDCYAAFIGDVKKFSEDAMRQRGWIL